MKKQTNPQYLKKWICGTTYWVLFFHEQRKNFSPFLKENLWNNYGLRATDKPNLGTLSNAFVSISPEIVNKDFGIISCCRSAPSFPLLFSFPFTTVRWSTAYDPPTVKVFSFVENFRVISPTAALLLNWSK